MTEIGDPPTLACVVELRPMRVADIAWIRRWDEDPDVVAAVGRGADWYDWPLEIARRPGWRELLIGEDDGRPVGFVQLIDAAREETHYWGDVEPGAWALDIWIGAPADRGRGLGAELMRLALDRCFERHGARSVMIDPRVTNVRAIRFYERLGFESVGERCFGDDDDPCLVMRITRAPRA